MRPALGFVTVLAITSAATAAPVDPPANVGRAFEIADYYRVAFPSAPAASPRGKLAAVSVTRYEIERGTSWSEIWLINTDGTGSRQMTFGRNHDSSPVFSPDGARLVFVSDRDIPRTQLFVMPVDGGEARQLTDFPTGVADPVWSPDGKLIAVRAEVYPECGADAECNRTILEATEAGPLAVRVADELLYRHWTSWREDRFSHVLLVDAESGEVISDLTPGRWDAPTFSLDGGGYAFAPDGSELCFVSNHDPEPAQSTNADLWVVPIAMGTGGTRPSNITAQNHGWDGDPTYSPDGRFIAYRSQATPGYEADYYRIVVYDRTTGATRVIVDRDTFDNQVNDLRWDPRGKSLFFRADVAGETPIYRIGLASKDRKIQRVHSDGAISGWQVTTAGQEVVYTRSKVGAPPEIFVVPAAGGDERAATRFNDELAQEVDIRPAETMWVDGENGRKIQVFIVKPHGFDPERRYPVILNVHGGPQMQWMDRFRGDWQVYPGKGYVVAFPNPTGSSGFGQDFIDEISCDWGGAVYRDLMKVADALEEVPWIDGDRMGAMGWSYGGYMMMWMAGHTDRFQALASMMGVYDLRSMFGATEELWFVEHDLCGLPWTSDAYDKWSPSHFAEHFATPTLVITGERDYRVPYTQSLQFFTDLQVRGVPSRLVVFPDAGHWPSWYEMAFYYLIHLDWFQQWLGGGAPPWDPLMFRRNQIFTGDGANLAAPGPGD